MTTDAELLRQYGEGLSEEAFGELVRRHLDLVYTAALRHVNGDAHLAEDVTQRVFSDLAKKARSLSHRTDLVGWLYTSTHFAAAKAIREERRRKARETEAYEMNKLLSSCSTPDADWNRIWPVLDEAMHELDEDDREIVLLRFFQKVPLAGVGERLGLSANATAKRVERVLEKLRSRLAKRGIASTSGALAIILADRAISAAPVSLETTVTVAALFSAGRSGGTAAGIFQIMGTKTTLGVTAVLGIAGILSIGGVATAVYELRAAQRAQAALVASRHGYQAQQGRLEELENSAKEADGRVTEIRHNLDRLRAAAARAKIASATAAHSASNRDPKVDGKNFLATFGQARAMLIEVGKAWLSRQYAAFYRSAGLTPAQIAQFEDQTAAFTINYPVVTPNGMSTSVDQLPDGQLRQILGDKGFQQFQEYQRMLPAENFAIGSTVVVGYTAEPLSADQTAQLAQVVANNSSSYQNGGKADSSSVDWNAVAEQARSLFSPSQWQAAESLFLRQQLSQAVTQAQNSVAPTDNP